MVREHQAKGSTRALLACTPSHARMLRFTQLTAPLEAKPGQMALLSIPEDAETQRG